MIEQFQNYIETNNLCKKSDRLLLGISGGIDSVCMLHLFKELNYSIGVAHCNFQLRGEESEQDETFVRNLANEFDLPFFSVRFETEEIAEQEGISIQMAARDLRYDWFKEIKEKYEYDIISIAHNRDDAIETFLINLTRGTGIKGLTGIKAKSGDIIRPLLFASRNAITDYISLNDLKYREDSSNKSIKYSRNLIRHELIPLFEQINPKFRETIINTIEKLNETGEVYRNEIEKTKQDVLIKENNTIEIDINKVKELKPLSTYLFELLKPFKFSNTQLNDILNSLDGISGKKFISTTHRLIKDRDKLIIEEFSSIHNRTYYIEENTEKLEIPIKLEITCFEKKGDFEITKSAHIGYFDYNKLQFPLILRKWQKGDYFMPLGMKNLKKVSDFFIDNKLSLSEKENIWIIESNNKIIWIIGLRIDERFKITEKTQKILNIIYVQ